MSPHFWVEVRLARRRKKKKKEWVKLAKKKKGRKGECPKKRQVSKLMRGVLKAPKGTIWEKNVGDTDKKKSHELEEEGENEASPSRGAPKLKLKGQNFRATLGESPEHMEQEQS